jgi:hypothetical protein
MVKRISDNSGSPGSGAGSGEGKSLHPRRMRLKHLHQHNGMKRAEMENLSPDQLPPASSSNAARQVRSRLGNTFPVNWVELHREIEEQKGE